MFKELWQKIVDFYYPVVPDEGFDLVRRKCDNVLIKHDVGDEAFEKAIALRMQVDSFEAELERNKPVKPKRKWHIDPAILVAFIGAGAQMVCTWMVERFQTDGGIFKSGTTNWINGGNLLGKFMTPHPNKENS